MFSLGPNVWRDIWDGIVHKDCAENSVKYEDVEPYLVTMNSAYGLKFIDANNNPDSYTTKHNPY